MTALVDTAAVLKNALAFIEEAGATHHDQRRVAEVREHLKRTLAEIRSANRVRGIKDLANRVGKSPETVRRALLLLFPGSKQGGRHKPTPEMAVAIIAYLS